MTDFVEPTSFAAPSERGLSTGAGRAHARHRGATRPRFRRCSTRWTKRRPKAASRWPRKRASAHENKLVQARLGMASGLHAALRAKHPPTASHCLRVALGCSSWAAAMELDDETRDVLEVAALLHDVGKIGVPDKVLLKPGRLLPEEIALMSRHAARTIEILASCGVPQSVLEIVHYSRAWYGSNGRPAGSAGRRAAAGVAHAVDRRCVRLDDDRPRLPPGPLARTGAGRAVSNSPAASSIRSWCGDFEELFSQDQNLLTEKLARRWLHRLPQDGSALPWKAVVEYERAEPRRATRRRRCSKRS